ncbi:hypothetical protein EGW08_016703 [Elysia chlorotica]|uniref:Uncharacterized protein n=1 Tax=Elysia chlorotica TaxID=188477 RepID=A0A3S1AWR7_ELYCH|nr:hypothetical protein EGW08_021961 [Elysia chlorotica]RUS75535.1 hypothetical protein EGW08_016703 [Elysia chlorotica]
MFNVSDIGQGNDVSAEQLEAQIMMFHKNHPNEHIMAVEGVIDDGPTNNINSILKYSNPLYFKTLLIPILASWPLTFVIFIIYAYNTMRGVGYISRPPKVTAKMIFLPLLLVPMIVDNYYDLITKASVSEYDSDILLLIIIAMALFVVISIAYITFYCFQLVQNNNYIKKSGYTRLSMVDSISEDAQENDGNDDERGGAELNVNIKLPSRIKNPNRWDIIVNEYMTMNGVYGLMIYNILLLIIYVMRYLTNKDTNCIRETDVAIISAVLGALLIPNIIFDWLTFKIPQAASLVMHYYLISVFALNFTLDFYDQLEYCEEITLGITFAATFLTAGKFKLFNDIGGSVTTYKMD